MSVATVKSRAGVPPAPRARQREQSPGVGFAAAGRRDACPASAALWRIELAACAILIVLLNLPLLEGRFDTRFAFLPEAVRAGEWWRVFTHPFVHVSLYHLALDAAAFFVLYAELRDNRRRERNWSAATAPRPGRR